MTSVHEADYQCNATNSVGTIISRIAKLRAGKWRGGEGGDWVATLERLRSDQGKANNHFTAKIV